MPLSLASKGVTKANGQQQFIETVDPNIVDIRDDLIIADGEKDVSCPVYGSLGASGARLRTQGHGHRPAQRSTGKVADGACGFGGL